MNIMFVDIKAFFIFKRSIGFYNSFRNITFCDNSKKQLIHFHVVFFRFLLIWRRFVIGTALFKEDTYSFSRMAVCILLLFTLFCNAVIPVGESTESRHLTYSRLLITLGHVWTFHEIISPISDVLIPIKIFHPKIN